MRLGLAADKLAGWLKALVKRSRIRTPTIIQMEAVECGATALAIILAHYGRWVPLEQLRSSCGVSRDGAKASNILKAARQLGMHAKGLMKDAAEAIKFGRPMIVFWNFNHYVVVEGASKTAVFLNDPALGPRQVSHDEFRASYTGITLDLVPGPDFSRGGERRRLGKALAKRLAGAESAVTMLLVATLFLVVPGFLLPAFVKTFVDDVLTLGFDRWLFPLIVGLAIVALLNAGLTLLQQRTLLSLENRLGVSSGAQFMWRALRLPVDFYAQRFAGDIASRLQSVQRVSQLLAGPLPTNLVNCLTVGFYAAIMMIYSAPLTLVTVGLTVINFALVSAVSRKRRDMNMALLNQSAKLQGASIAGLQAIESIKASATENDFYSIWSGYQTQFLNSTQSLARYSIALSAVPILLNSLSATLVLGYGGALIIKGKLTIGGLVAFQALLQQFNTPVTQLVGLGGQLQEIEGDLNRLDDLMLHSEDPVFTSGGSSAEPRVSYPSARLSGAVELREVSFAYSQFDTPLIKDFSLSIAPGHRVALVGSTGSGKSTLVRMILGLYRPTGGEILFDGQSIDRIPREMFTASVGAVMQEGHLFQGSVVDNLTMWNAAIPRETIVRAAQDACIHEVIAARGGGYDSDLSEMGRNLSGGQWQRLEIARALVSDPSILVLDEATSALDPLTEREIDQNLRRRGCTCIIVAHRLSTIRDCDEIIVLDRGKIAERGTHETLMSLGKKYAGLVALSA
jgi:NHLM bacteriocin system ABC transporter peptidase/ATP-binding protein